MNGIKVILGAIFGTHKLQGGKLVFPLCKFDLHD